ncbi:uncharacterized protein [Haliotis cracherodii]|uniref:uncharacterized protein n=1 Tax=Haliotis cracherodii TaxID=6455 RepID=UPI0039EBA4E3
MTTKYFCMTNSRRLTLRRTASVLVTLCLLCFLLHSWLTQVRQQGGVPVERQPDLNWHLNIRTTVPHANHSALLKLSNQQTYILSAIIPADQSDTANPVVVVNAFDGSNVRLVCCVLEDGRKLHVTWASTLRQYHHLMFLSTLTELFYTAPYPARQIACPLTSPVGSATHISLSSSTCSTHPDQYQTIVHVPERAGQLAVCGKIAYSHALMPERLVEWFEFQRVMGVDMVLIFTLDITRDVQMVFDFYAKQGLLTTVPYQLPGHLERSFRKGNRSFPQFSHDEQLAIFDCRERLSGYSHVAGIDLDEIIVPRSGQTLKQLLKNSLSKEHPDAGAYYFYQQFHITDWGPSHPNNTLTTMRFLQTDPPRWESQKFVYIPDRTTYGRTHEVFVKSGYSTYTIPPEVAIIHHFRTCPETWLDCQTRARIVDTDTLRYQEQMDFSVKTVMEELQGKGVNS